jgi:peptidoglycan L-alanyl-D-glutamate endopeptidase CwlK
MINSRNLNDLDPKARVVCEKHIAFCAAHNIEIIVTSTYRDYESQEALYAIGRTTDLKRSKVTNARAGHSWHNFRCAWDVVPVVNGKPVWDAKDPIWKQVIMYGKEAGAEAGAEWKSFPDLPHFQVVPEHMPLEVARIQFDKTGSIFT